MNADLIVDARCDLGEGPAWDAPRGWLWWTDIDGRAIWRFDPVTQQTETLAPPDRVGFVAIASGGRLLLGGAKALYVAEPERGVLAATKLVDIEPDLATTRVNDGRVDRFGNVVFGTLDEQRPRRPIGSFYQFSSAYGLRRMDLPGAAVSNSICFSPDGRRMYFTDTSTGVIRRGDYDPETAAVEDVHDFVVIAPSDGHPDGSIVDADGCLWNAAWGGGVVRRFTPEGRLDCVVRVPAKNPTCPAFGDSGLGTLYITSSRQQHTADELARAPQSGGVFALRLSDIRGIPDKPFV